MAVSNRQSNQEVKNYRIEKRAKQAVDCTLWQLGGHVCQRFDVLCGDVPWIRIHDLAHETNEQPTGLLLVPLVLLGATLRPTITDATGPHPDRGIQSRVAVSVLPLGNGEAWKEAVPDHQFENGVTQWRTNVRPQVFFSVFYRWVQAVKELMAPARPLVISDECWSTRKPQESIEPLMEMWCVECKGHDTGQYPHAVQDLLVLGLLVVGQDLRCLQGLEARDHDIDQCLEVLGWADLRVCRVATWRRGLR